MNSNFLNMVRNMTAVDVSSTANYKTASAIAKHPKAKFPNPVETAFAIDIDVSVDFADDPDFQEVVDAYVKTLNNIYSQLHDDFPKQADIIFAQMVHKMTLKYSY